MSNTVTIQGVTFTANSAFRVINLYARLDVNNARLDIKS